MKTSFEMESTTTDVLVIGAGAAGIRAALAASEAGVKVMMVAKGRVTESGSTFSPMSQGWGIQALAGPERTEKNLEAFYDDIMRVGLGKCDAKLVRILVEESGPCLEELMSLGIRFRKDDAGNHIRVKGCFSDCPRAFVTEDAENVKHAFLAALRRSSVKLLNGHAVDLMVSDRACWGAWVMTGAHGMVGVGAKATVLATGGGSGVFENHFVSQDDTGDGYALAYRAGATLDNLQFIQLMLGLKDEKARFFLPLKALQQPAVLQDQEGQDILEQYIPDVQLRAEALEQRPQHFPFSCRDVSCHVDVALARARLKSGKVGWRGVSEAPMPPPYRVVHFAHAFNGGLRISETAESTIVGLFAAGEVAAGPHGADRIGGCMMTATQVFGKRAGQFGARRAKALKRIKVSHPDSDGPVSWGKTMFSESLSASQAASAVRRRVRETMEAHTMVLRDGRGLRQSTEILGDCNAQLEEMKRAGTISLRTYLDLRNVITTAGLVTESALDARQSLGPHLREDYPPTILSS